MSTLQITYDGTTIDNTNGIYLNGISGIDGLPIRASESNLMGRDGGNVFNTFYGMRTIILNGSIIASTVSDFITKKNTIVSLFKRSSTPKEMQITLWDGVSSKSIFGNIVKAPEIVYNPRNLNNCVFNIEFRCSDPFFTDTVDTVEVLNLANLGGFDFPFDFPVDFGAFTTANQLVINNTGDAVVYPTIRFAGDVINPTLTNQTTGKFVQIEDTISVSDYVEISFDTNGLSVLKNGAVNYISYLNSNEPENALRVELGNNTLAFTASTFSANATCTITYRLKSLTI